MDDMKTVKPLEESNLLIRDVSETIKNEAKEQKGGFLSMLLGTLALSLLGSALAGKGVMRGDEGMIRAGKGTIGRVFNAASIFKIILKYKNIIKMNLYLMVLM